MYNQPMRRRQTYSAPGITVTFDPEICIHSAVCLASLPAVFDVGRRRWVRPEAASVEEVAAVVERCPSGALQYRLEGAAEPEAAQDEITTGQATIRLSRDGPLRIEGPFQVLDENGTRLPTSGRAALCRCGGTSNQPFCDGTHTTRGFRSRRGSGGSTSET